MSGEVNQTRRWLINASGAAILSNAIGTAQAQETAPATAAGRARRDVSADPTVDETPRGYHLRGPAGGGTRR